MALRLAGEELGVVQGDAAAAATLDETSQEFLKSLAALYGWDGADLSRLRVESAANPNLRVTPYVGPDRWLNNTEVTILANAARTSTTNSPDQTNYNARGLLVHMDITAVPGGDTVILRLQFKDPVSGIYDTLLSDAAVSVTGIRTAIIYPGVGAASNGIHVVQSRILSRTWRVAVAHSGSGSFTYSVSAAYIL